ncbi:unnamed protein product [Rangifer tarandus platyrhynchus]|uniref:Uncharacterized protein n=2 Tax=Rangifer tarandus platyrhynchus TaxID=3082113 RepID=A0AC59YWF8_RANTA|nr:unnamed protein product [Rangifer tarandus platyrhynchus]
MLGVNRFRGIVVGGFQSPSSVGSDWASLPSLALAPPLGQSSSLWLVLQAAAARLLPLSPLALTPGLVSPLRSGHLCPWLMRRVGERTAVVTSYIPTACRTSSEVKLSCLSH